MKKEIEESTEQRIVEAARSVFTQCGFDGARMQEIADKAGINKALLHYYFRSKEKLFDLIFSELLGKFHLAFLSILASEKPLIEKIRLMVETDIELLSKYPDIPLFIIYEVARDPKRMSERARMTQIPELFEEFAKQVRTATRKGEIKKIEPVELLINILALNRFPFIGKPMIQAMTGLSEEKFQAMMKRRKTEVAELIINDLVRVSVE